MQNAHFESHIIGFTFVRRALFNVFLRFSSSCSSRILHGAKSPKRFFSFTSVFFLLSFHFKLPGSRQALWILDLYMRLEIRLNARHLLSNANANAYNTMHSMRIAHPILYCFNLISLQMLWIDANIICIETTDSTCSHRNIYVEMHAYFAFNCLISCSRLELWSFKEVCTLFTLLKSPNFFRSSSFWKEKKRKQTKR